jgi:hypothetical protein
MLMMAWIASVVSARRWRGRRVYRPASSMWAS